MALPYNLGGLNLPQGNIDMEHLIDAASLTLKEVNRFHCSKYDPDDYGIP